MATLLCVSFIVAPIVSPAPVSDYMGSHAQAGFLDKVKKSVKGVKKGVGKALGGKNGLGKVLTVVGAGAIGAGLVTGKAGPVIIGLGLVAAPLIFREEMERKYGKEQSWAGCLTCGKKRVLVQPGRNVADAEKKQILARITEDVKDTQRALKTLGYYKKGIDGDFGKGSRLAAQQFQQSISVTPTGTLTAAERSQLFKLAKAQGFEPQSDIALASLRPVTNLPAQTAVPVSTTLPAATVVSTLKYHKLAQSRVSKFAEDVLMYGPLTEVQSVSMRRDGLLEISMVPAAGAGPVIGGVETITVAPHELTDEWALVTMEAAGTGDEVILNTVDSFMNGDEARAWIEDANEKIVRLEKLTERETSQMPETQLVEATPSKEQAAPSVETVVAEKTEAESAPEGLTDVVEVSAEGSTTPESPETTVAAKPVADAAKEVVAAEDSDGASEPVEVVDSGVPAAERQCMTSLYVSFRFPEGFEKVNHFNIKTPESAIMTDNGDGTGYLTGSCIQGKYSYTYVVVDHDKAKKKYSSHPQEGAFEIASLAGNCEINLNDPTKSASMSCY